MASKNLRWKLILTVGIVLATTVTAPKAHAAATDINAWQSTSALSTATLRPQTASYNGYVYVIGGVNASISAINTVEYAKQNTDGTLGAWQTTTSYPTTLDYGTAAAYQGHLFVFGGITDNGFAATDAVYSAVINNDGSLGAWQAQGTLPQVLAQMSSVQYNGKVYLIDGDNISSRLQTVYYADLNNDGTVGTWQTTTQTPEINNASRAAISGNTIYVMGGYNGTNIVNHVYYAAIQNDGTVGAWQSTTLPDALTDFQTYVLNGALYISGGYDDTLSQFLDATQYATINNDGSLGAWQTSAQHLPVASFEAGSAQIGDWLYYLGGFDGDTALSTANYTKLAAPVVNSTPPPVTTYQAPDTGLGYSAHTTTASWLTSYTVIISAVLAFSIATTLTLY